MQGFTPWHACLQKQALFSSPCIDLERYKLELNFSATEMVWVEWECVQQPIPLRAQNPACTLAQLWACPEGQVSDVCVCFSLLEELPALHWANEQLYNFQGPPGFPGIIPVPEDPTPTPGDFQPCPQARCTLPSSWSSSLQSGAEQENRN